METPAWRNRIAERKQIPSAVLALAKDAQHAGCWIQDNSTFEWYTPDEFRENWKRLYIDDRRHGDNIKRFSVRDPMVGERAMKKRMRDAMADYLNFRRRLEDYYVLELRPKK